MNSIFRTAAIACAATVFAAGAMGETQETLLAELQAALTANDLAAALPRSTDLYEAAIAANDVPGAGAAAYMRAEILTAQNAHGDAAKAYEVCERHYRSAGAAAQSLQCALRAATALQSAGQPGTGLDKLQAVERELEAIGQDRSGFAAGVYMALAQASLPPKLHRLEGARSKRERAIAYTNQAMTALEAIGETETDLYASALLLRAEAQEDMKAYEAAVASYEAFLALYTTLPDASAEVLKTAYNRYQIAQFELEGGKEDTLTVPGRNGEQIVLTIDRKRDIRTPREDSHRRLADGASVNARITLKEDGRVETIKILSSEPNEKYGEAFEKGVRHWRFIPPKGVSGADVPPFEYGIIFYVTRRN